MSIFWGRAPEKQESILRALFADTWVVPGTFEQLVRLTLHGRDTLIKFGEAIDAAPARAAEAAAEGLRRAHHAAPRGAAAARRVPPRAGTGGRAEPLAPPDPAQRGGRRRPRCSRRSLEDKAQREGLPVEQAELAARRIAYGIASDYSYAVIRALDIALTGLWNRIYDGVEVHRFEDVSARRRRRGADLRALPPQPHRLPAAVLRRSITADCSRRTSPPATT
ncbi:MAG: hypothetical protein MZW92_63675 [Comamonadaceae bacterium]|nr:hypothetical protein [Comamonadaceae bacterium]